MHISKYSNRIGLHGKRASVTIGLIKGLYLGIQIDAEHLSIDLGIVFIDLYW